jgi:hypothetical protein
VAVVKRVETGTAIVEICRQSEVPEAAVRRWKRSYRGDGHFGSETAVREWLEKEGCKNIYIKPGSPWGNTYIESFMGKSTGRCRESFQLVHKSGAGQGLPRQTLVTLSVQS